MRLIIICFSVLAIAGCKKETESVTCACYRDNYFNGVYQNSDTIVNIVKRSSGHFPVRGPVSAEQNCNDRTKEVIKKTGADHTQICKVTE